jgi:hypothetical protein
MAVYTCFWLYPFTLTVAFRNFSSSVIIVGQCWALAVCNKEERMSCFLEVWFYDVELR